MIGIRTTAGILTAALAAVAVGVTACASPEEPIATAAQTAAVSSQPRPEPQTPLVEQPLPDVPGKTFSSATVDFPPGASAVPHRHGDALVYAYVLEGTVRSKLDDTPIREYHQGENWIEQPGAHHVLTENSSQTEPAKLLVVFVSDTGDNLKVDDPQP